MNTKSRIHRSKKPSRTRRSRWGTSLVLRHHINIWAVVISVIVLGGMGWYAYQAHIIPGAEAAQLGNPQLGWVTILPQSPEANPTVVIKPGESLVVSASAYRTDGSPIRNADIRFYFKFGEDWHTLVAQERGFVSTAILVVGEESTQTSSVVIPIKAVAIGLGNDGGQYTADAFTYVKVMPTPRIDHITVTPDNSANPAKTIKSGEKVTFRVKAYDKTGAQMPIPPSSAKVIYTANNDSHTQWKITGTTNNLMENSADIQFTLGEDQVGPASVQVVASVEIGEDIRYGVSGFVKILPIIRSVTIQQRNATIKSGSSFVFTVKLKDQRGKDITSFYHQCEITLKWSTSSGTNVVLNPSSDKTNLSFTIRPVLQGNNSMAMVMIGIEANQNGKKVTDFVTARVTR